MLHAAASSQAAASRPAAAARAAAAPAPAAAPSAAAAAPSTSGGSASDPLMLRALRGEAVERPPVWAMRQAGRCMKVYRDMCKTHKTFRERSENADLAVEVSLQPYRAFSPDGVILFSDILTPLPGMNIPFDIVEGKGPLIADPIRSMAQVDALTPLDSDGTCPFVGQALRALRSEVGNKAAVLGFVGAPFTLATYVIEGGSSKSFVHTKRMAFAQPEILHALCERLADSIADYVRYQADAGAQAVQIFDSWASHLSPQDFDVFSAPYIKRIIDSVRLTHPTLPIILYISGSGGLLERMAACGPDVISLDQSVDLVEGIRRVNGADGKTPVGGGARGTGQPFAIQGNLDPGVLFGDQATVERRVLETIRRARGEGVRHVMNLGHGVLPGTPEENVAHYFEVARTAHERGI